MKSIQLLIDGNGGKELVFEVKKMINAGRTGRDQEEVKKHVEELRKQGISTPAEVPSFYPILPEAITTDNSIVVLPDSRSSGEVEYVLLLDGSAIYVGVGSDHTDRELEKSNILISKQICPNVISKKVWRYEDVKKYWDDSIIRSWIEKEGQRQLYQEAKLVKMMRPEELIEKVKSRVHGDMTGMVIYSGTVSVIGGEMFVSNRFEVELVDENKGRSLSCAYSIEPITWFR